LKHLVIGYGNMGKRHAEILRGFGDEVDSVDLEWTPKQDYSGYDSVLVCSPAEKHFEHFRDIPLGIPVFVEKPIATHFLTFATSLPATMVGCNWRYCQCADMSFGDIEIGYRASKDTAYLDLIHFLDTFWTSWGKPEFGGVGTLGKKIEMVVSTEKAVLSVAFDPSSKKPYTRRNGKPVHAKGACDMFAKQMRDWRECVRLGRPHLNDFATAAERTNWLISRWARPES
jgi:hypothetical protein